MMAGKGPHRLPTAHFPHFPSTLSSMEGGSPSSWPPVSLHTHSPLACLGAVRTEPTRPCITVITMHRPQCQPWEALDVPPPGPTPKLFLCVQRTLSIVSSGQSLPHPRLVLEGPCHLPALILASPLAPRVGLSSLPPTMPLGLQGTPPPQLVSKTFSPDQQSPPAFPALSVTSNPPGR